MKKALLLIIAALFFSINAYGEEQYEYVIGRGISDITGPAYGIQLWGFGKDDQISEGIHIRQKARAFIIADNERNKRIAFVSADIGSIEHHITLEVLDRLTEQFGKQYQLDNVILSATHTHAAPTGYWHSRTELGLDGGFYPEHFNSIVDGIVEAISKAHDDLQPGNIYINRGRVENAGINRSLIAYKQNPESERKQYSDSIDKDMTLLKFVDASGAIGLLNWLAVHPTSMTFFNRLISGDHKGYASLNVERKKGVTYRQQDGFVAAFAQTNAGDVTPNLNLDNTGPGKDDFDSTKIIGQRQVDVALDLFANASELLKGSIDYRQVYVNLSQFEVSEKFSGQGTQHTCPSAYGYSFAGGSTEDGGGHFLFEEGMTNQNMFLDFLIKFLTGAPKWTEAVKQCQSPKAILFETGTGTPPAQSQIRSVTVARIGQLAIVALPAEVTTMAGRRLRQTVKAQLGDWATDIVLAGYSNGYAGYVTTPQEYDLQQYEAGHTLHGRWTLPAYQQVTAELAFALQNKTAPKQTVIYDDWRGKSPTLKLHDGSPDQLPEGATLEHSLPLDQKTYSRGETVTTRFYSGNPTAQYNRQNLFLSVEMRQDETWVEISNDHDWSSKIRWVKEKKSKALIAQLSWETADDTASGQYRMKHTGMVRLSDGSTKKFAATSDAFTIQ
ncbi:MAG: neutral ceramidase [Pseudoalteromonas tetraodonis]|jgi:neutral ceramidase